MIIIIIISITSLYERKRGEDGSVKTTVGMSFGNVSVKKF